MTLVRHRPIERPFPQWIRFESIRKTHASRNPDLAGARNMLTWIWKFWRPEPESNRRIRICSPLRHHSAIGPPPAQMGGIGLAVNRPRARLPAMHAAANWAGRALKPVLDFALPPRCPGCGTVTEAPHRFCLDCWSALRFLGEPCCHRCALPFDYESGPDVLCGACLAHGVVQSLHARQAVNGDGQPPAARSQRLRQRGYPAQLGRGNNLVADVDVGHAAGERDLAHVRSIRSSARSAKRRARWASSIACMVAPIVSPG